ncbi:structure-specific endonuclease subunit slx1 [Cynara cardunculus var. scolymus]|uniref:structure-specific endonuclease subunit slx1 n=1 Tax=Cynara cardunculus var. scolymus TaxID=59895 RepID=UPI000D62D0DF|nr:structure-specific endonuclease subunit slx1 [Cynara cardunculus var. scolymus]
MWMTRLLSTTFSSIKPHSRLPKSTSESNHLNWSIYLILSTNPPFKTYVGVTTNFSRRLRQHNGELKGGAKASQAGRPWICACLIRGFASKSEACKFEFKWKNVSSKMPRKRKSKEEEGGIHLLQHRNAALNKVKDSSDCSHLEFEWKLEPI